MGFMQDKVADVAETTPSKVHGFTWFIASVFIVGETAGSGLVALPSATMHAGFVGGSILLLAMCLLLGYTALLLGENWLIMRRLWPKYAKEPCRNPYPEMARRAVGPLAELVVNLCSYLTLFGGMAVFAILASKNISDLLSLFNINIHFCIVMAAISVMIWPFMMLRSPADFWQASIGAAAATCFAVVILLIGISIDTPACMAGAKYTEFSMGSLSMSFGTMIFSYCGHPCLPTIQNDMKDPRKFKKAVVLAYAVMFFLYAPISLFGYSVYGNSLTDTITSSIQSLILRQTVNVMITLHVLFSMLVIGNPVLQGVEAIFNVKDNFGIGRFTVRTIVFFAAIIMAASMPNFGIFLDLIGGSTMTILSIIMPGLFSLYLTAAETKKNLENLKSDDVVMPTFKEVLQLTPKRRVILELSIIAFGTFCGIVCTANTLRHIPNSTLSTPCYLEIFRGASITESNSVTRCCGEFHNITTNSESFFCGI